MINENFVYLGLIITFLGSAGYFIKTIQGKAKPNRVTWFLWGVVPLIAFAAQLDQVEGPQKLLTLFVGLDPLLIFFASFVNKKAYWKIDKRDYLFGGLSILGLILWLTTGVGNIAILFSILSDLLAAIPTVIKSFRDPESESAFGFVAPGIASVITLLTIKEWNFATYGFPLYIFLICFVLSFLILSKIGKNYSTNK